MKNRKVAVIDEDEEILGELEEILTASGYIPLVVNDALSAVEITARNKPDIILLELRMPSKNGFELADEMNRVFEAPRIPIIAMSAHLKEDPFFLMNLCGINRYIRKPFRPLDVIWAIENVTEESHPWDKERYMRRWNRDLDIS